MKTLRTILLGVVGLMCVWRPAAAQTVNDIRVVVAAFTVAKNGGEKPVGMSHLTGPVTPGQGNAAVWSVRDCGYFSLHAKEGAPFEDRATTGWRVAVTTTSVTSWNRAVTFRLRWVRALDTSKDYSSPKSEDIELTLRPGESRVIDSVMVPSGAATFDGSPCATESALLRVSVEHEMFDRRLVGADVWLVEKLANGKEQSQPQAVRGLPHREIPFYFDRLPEMNLDFFGTLITHPEQGGLEVALEAIRGRADPSKVGYESMRWFRSTLHVKPDEIVEVALPKLEDSAYANRTFALRIRARQIR